MLRLVDSARSVKSKFNHPAEGYAGLRKELKELTETTEDICKIDA